MTIWFAADLHLHHAKVIAFSQRPFNTVDEMNAAFFAELQAKWSRGDTLYLLGDVVFKKDIALLDKLRLITGTVHLIAGNHDGKSVRKFEGWSSVSDIKQIKIGDQKIVLCHFPLEHWNGRGRGYWHLHGHSHGNTSHRIDEIPYRRDVGYDATGQWLISFEEIKRYFSDYRG